MSRDMRSFVSADDYYTGNTGVIPRLAPQLELSPSPESAMPRTIVMQPAPSTTLNAYYTAHALIADEHPHLCTSESLYTGKCT